RRRVGVEVRAPEEPTLIGQRFEPEQGRQPLPVGPVVPGIHHAGTADIPPSTTRSCPLIQRAIGEARNTQASATSVRSPSLPNGTARSQLVTPSGQSSRRPGRATRPGDTVFTRTPSRPYSSAAARANMIVAAFADA